MMPKRENRPGNEDAEAEVSLWAEIGIGIRPFLVSFAIDLAKFCLVLAGLFLVFVFERSLKLAGYDEVKLKYFEDFHFWLSLMTVGILGIDFILKLVFSFLKAQKRPIMRAK